MFCDLFRIKKYVLQLDQVVFPNDAAESEDELTLITERNILGHEWYNDLGYLRRDVLLVLTEAQSTWTPNIIPRSLVYAVQTLQDDWATREMSPASNNLVKVPKIEVFVLYTGSRKDVAGIHSLADVFCDGDAGALDYKVRVIASKASKDNILMQYKWFTLETVEKAVQKYGTQLSEETLIHSDQGCRYTSVSFQASWRIRRFGSR